jgi:cation diffusion facilitator family transporter
MHKVAEPIGQNVHTKDGIRVTLEGATINLALIFLKLGVGVVGGSRALVADAAHSMSDLVSDGVVIWGLVIGGKPSDESHHYGHAKVELLAEMLLGVILVAAGTGIALDAVKAALSGEMTRPAIIVLPVAAAGALAKEYLFRRTMVVAIRTGKGSLLANAWHHRSDALTSLGVLAGAALAMVSPVFAAADALVAALVAAVVIKVGAGIGWEAASRIVDTAPSRDYQTTIVQTILAVPRTLSVRNLKMRYVGRRIAVEVHLGLDPKMSVKDSHDVAVEVKRTVMDKDQRVFDVLVHVEPEEAQTEGSASSG